MKIIDPTEQTVDVALLCVAAAALLIMFAHLAVHLLLRVERWRLRRAIQRRLLHEFRLLGTVKWDDETKKRLQQSVLDLFKNNSDDD